MPPLQVWVAIPFLAANLWAVSPIGSIHPSGKLLLNGLPVTESVTFPAGAAFASTEAGSRLTLVDGVKIQIDADTRLRVWDGRLELERGRVEVTGEYRVDTAGTQVQVQPGGRVAVEMRDRVNVSSIAGITRVVNPEGRVLEFLPAGKSGSYSLEGAKSRIEKRLGCLMAKDSRFLLQDDASGEVVELRGPDLGLNLGNRAEITGSLESPMSTVSPATAVFQVTSVSPRSRGGCLSVAAAIGANTTSPTAKP